MVFNFLKSICLSAALFVVYSLQGPNTSFAQCTGRLQPGTVCGNPGSSTAAPSATINPVLGGGSSQGTITLTPGSTPGSLVNGKLWATSAGVFAYINGSPISLGGAGSGSIVIGSTPVSGGTTGRVLYDNGGLAGELPVTGAGNVVLSTSPTLVTPSLGVATVTTVNGLTVTSGSSNVITIPSGVSFVLSGSNNLTLTTTGPTNVTLPTTGTLLTNTATSLPGLVTVGTLTGGATGAGFTVAIGTSTVTGVLGVSNGGTSVASGTSGGILAFTGTATLVSTSALTAGIPVIGGGAGVAPSSATRSGNTTKYPSVGGSLVSGNCLSTDANLNIVDAGGPCTTGGGGGTVGSGAQGQLPYYAGAGTTTAIIGNANINVSSGALTLGIATSVQGQLKLAGAGSGTITITGQAASGTYEFDLPITAGTSGQPLLSAGGAGSPMTFGTLSVGGGGTGRTTLTNHGVLVGASTGAITQLSAAAAGTVLQGAGASSDPAFSSTPTLGVQQTTQGQLILANTAAGSFSLTLQSSNSASAAWTMTFPVTAGISGQVLSTDGSGVTSWVANAASLVVGSTSISGGTNGRVLYDTSGTLGELAVTGSGNVVLSASPTLSGTVTGPAGTWTAANGLNVAGGGLGITSGTSGGIPYFSSSNTIASSGTLTASLPVIGGGAGVAPTVGSRSGNTTTFATTSGSLTSGNIAKFDANGNVVDGGVSISVPVTVANGGTGDTSLTSNGVLYGNSSSTTGAVAATPAGTQGQCVAAGASSVPGFKSGCKVLVATLTASSSTSLSICPSACTSTFNLADGTYNEFEFIFENVLPASSSICEMTIQSGGSGAFKSTLYHSRSSGNGGAGSDINSYIPCSDSANAVLPTSGSGVSGTVTLHAPAGTFPLFVGQSFYLIAGINEVITTLGGVWYNASTGGTVSGVTFQFSTGNIASGTIKVYGYL